MIVREGCGNVETIREIYVVLTKKEDRSFDGCFVLKVHFAGFQKAYEHFDNGIF